MKAYLLLTSSGPLMVLTSHVSVESPELLEKLDNKGISKFLAYEVPVDLASERYGGHFSVVTHDLGETDDLRVLDFKGERIYQLFRFDELGEPVAHEGHSGGRHEDIAA